MSKRNTQCMYLNVERLNHPNPGQLARHRIGAVAVKLLPKDKAIIAASIVSLSEKFNKATGPFKPEQSMVKAINRLDPTEEHQLVVERKDLQQTDLSRLVYLLNLKSENNYYTQINWAEENERFKKTINTFLFRTDRDKLITKMKRCKPAKTVKKAKVSTAKVSKTKVKKSKV